MRPFSALSRLLLRSFFLHPLHNPVWPLLLIITIYFIFEGSFKREHALLLTCAFPLLHLFLGDPFRNREQGSPSFFDRLPLPPRVRFLAYFSSSALYMALVAAYLFYLLLGLSPMQYFAPDAYVHSSVTPGGDTLTLMTGSVPDYIYGEMPRFKEATFVVRHSLLFEGFGKMPGCLPMAGAFYLALLGNVILFHYRRLSAPENAGSAFRVLFLLPFAFYALAGLLVLADPFLTQHAVDGAIRWQATHPAVVRGLAGAAAACSTAAFAVIFLRTLEGRRGP